MLQTLNIAINLSAFLLSLLLLIVSGISSGGREHSFRWYFLMVLLTVLGTPCDLLVLALSGTPGQSVYIAMRILDFFSFGVTGLFIMAMARYFYDYISQKAPVSSAFLWFEGSIALLVTALVIGSQFVPWLASYGEDNTYGKGSLFWLYEALGGVALVACMVLTLRHIRHLHRREWVSLLIYSVLPLLCYVVDFFVAELWLSYLGSTLALFLIYFNIQLEVKNNLLQKEVELAQGRISMLLSQIQPHFIFNTLTSISEVCQDNPLALKSLLTFSGYLRANMDALTQKSPIPFAQELVHVKQYLWLEQLRFEEKLRVVYDIQTEDFMLPVLSLQPIVENAVKHGIAQKTSEGTVWIKVCRIQGGIQIRIEDDGVGFDGPSHADSERSHTGIANVRARLWEMGKGEIKVESERNKGTIATIWLPEGGGMA